MSSSNFKNESDEGVFGPVEKNRTLPEVLPALSLFIRDVARSRFAYISKMEDVVIEENKNWDDFSYGSSMSVILIAGKEFKLFFQGSFSSKKIPKGVRRRDIRRLGPGRISRIYKPDRGGHQTGVDRFGYCLRHQSSEHHLRI